MIKIILASLFISGTVSAAALTFLGQKISVLYDTLHTVDSLLIQTSAQLIENKQVIVEIKETIATMKNQIDQAEEAKTLVDNKLAHIESQNWFDRNITYTGILKGLGCVVLAGAVIGISVIAYTYVSSHGHVPHIDTTALEKDITTLTEAVANNCDKLDQVDKNLNDLTDRVYNARYNSPVNLSVDSPIDKPLETLKALIKK